MREAILVTFRAVGPDGQPTTVRASRLQAEATDTFDVGNPEANPAMWRYTAADGRMLRRLEKGRYQDVGGDTVFTSDDPAAP